MPTRRRFLGLATAALASPVILPSRALADNWPGKPVKIVVPFTPGGSTDITARLVGNRLQEIWSQSVVVENKPGAGGNIAADMVAHSDPDGYTVFIVGPGMATNKFLYPSLSYDPVGDFAPVTMLITQPNLMCVPNSSPAKSVKEFIDFCQANKGKVTFASSGNGTTLHLSGELFKRMAKVEMTHIPYRGGAPGFDVVSWFAFFVPVKTPADVIAKLNADTNAALVYPAVKSRFEDLGAVPKGSTPLELAAFLKSETDKWGPVIRDAQIKLEN
jgi:tripartite-type tricarboxylate transporter receptor subunit TctC